MEYVSPTDHEGPRPDTIALPALYGVPALDGDPSLAPALELALAALRRSRDGIEGASDEPDKRIEELEAFLAMVRDDDARVVVVPAREVYDE